NEFRHRICQTAAQNNHFRIKEIDHVRENDPDDLSAAANQLFYGLVAGTYCLRQIGTLDFPYVRARFLQQMRRPMFDSEARRGSSYGNATGDFVQYAVSLGSGQRTKRLKQVMSDV